MNNVILKLARTRLGEFLLRLAFSSFSFAIPVNRLRDTSTLIAFFHPQPSYPTHILVVPKRKYRSLLDVPPDDVQFMKDLFEVVGSLVEEFGLERAGYRLIVNGGESQDVRLLHFHLIAEAPSDE
ncbi:MAG: HIT domain-containing protein [Anaerolineales bacterium]|jgi:histidine triad (HIT) family protein